MTSNDQLPPFKGLELTVMASLPEIASLPQVKLSYNVDSCSSVSANFNPRNVLIDNPNNADSRWAGAYQSYPNPSSSSASLSKPPSIPSVNTSGSTFNPALRFGAGRAEGTLVGERGASGNGTSRVSKGGVDLTEGRNWLMLRLDKPAVLRTITFGKFFRPHPCTMKSFMVLAGMDKDNLKEILHSTLKHDGNAEVFEVGWREGGEGGLPVPTRYIKIIPLSAQGANYNTSIWYVAFGGIAEDSIVQKTFDLYTKARESRMLRLMLKHLRQNRLFEPFSALLASASSPITLEHPLLSQLHKTLVQDGDFSSAELLVNSLSAEGLFDPYLQLLPARADWTRLDTQGSTSEARPKPGKRAGHAMIVDEGDGLRPARLYLFGGYDGENNLDDLWIFEEGVWREVTKSKGEMGESNESKLWPSARSCHKMVLEPPTGDIYLTGRYIDEDASPTAKKLALNGSGDQEGQPTASGSTSGATEPAASSKGPVNDFWRFSAREGETWEVLSKDTAAEGGPPVVYDHEMIVDAESQAIYTFGGGDTFGGGVSGLFRYDLKSKTWSELLKDSDRSVPARSGHCMLWNSKTREFYIFGGISGPKYLADFWIYRPDTNELTSSSDFYVPGGPQPGFTQRAVLDVARNQIIVMSGLRKEPGSEESTTKRGVWLFDLERRTWSRLQERGRMSEEENNSNGKEPEDVSMEDAEDDEEDEPSARFAQQLVFDSRTETFWLFGGNVGGNTRLSDFWELKIERPLKSEIERLCLVACRKQRFIELSEGGPPLDALGYLQTQLHAVIHHDDPQESEMFVSLTGHLFSRPPHIQTDDSSSSSSPPTLEIYHKRTDVFNTIQSFIADSTQKEPEGDLAIMVDGGLGPLVV